MSISWASMKDGAEIRVLDAARGGRGKPSQKPAFPGAPRVQPVHLDFPGDPNALVKRRARPEPHIPRLRGAITVLDKRRFIRDAFGRISSYFQDALEKLARANPGVAHDFNPESASQFTAEIFVGGLSKSRCKIWIANQFGEGIAYFEGRDYGGGSNAMRTRF